MLIQKINISNRDTSNVLILDKQSDIFLYRSSLLWNLIHKGLIKFEESFATPVPLVKQRLKALILENQSLHDQNLWTDDNFELKPPKPVYLSINSESSENFSPFQDFIVVD